MFAGERAWGVGWGANILPREVSTARPWELVIKEWPSDFTGHPLPLAFLREYIEIYTGGE